MSNDVTGTEQRMAQQQGQIDRVRDGLQRHDLAAVVAVDQANLFYTSGYFVPSGRVGTSMSLTPLSEEQALIVSGFEESVARWISWIDDVRIFPSWIEVHEVEAVRAGTTQAQPKPVQFSKADIYQILAEVMREQGLDRERVGVEVPALSAQDLDLLRQALPHVAWINSKPLIFDARTVKLPHEIAALRLATELAEIGHQAVVAAPRGKTIQELGVLYRKAVFTEAAGREEIHGTMDVHSYITAGPRVGPNLLRDSHRVEDGDVIFIDSAVLVDGYASDIGRSYAVGEVDALARRIHDALHEGYLAGLDLLKPGVPMREVFDVVNRTIQRHFPSYVRGHFGHVPGVGFGEQPPFFAPSETWVLEENMVVNIETPYYVKGLGGFQIEDMLLVTADGHESFNRTSRELVRV